MVGAGDVEAVEAMHGSSAGMCSWLRGPQVLICDNETNTVALFGTPNNATTLTKDGINNRVVHGDSSAVRLAVQAPRRRSGTTTTPSRPVTRSRSGCGCPAATPKATCSTGATPRFSRIDATRPTSSTRASFPDRLSEEERFIARRAFAGLLWGKQLYRFNVRQWLEGDPDEPTPPPERRAGRNAAWQHLALADVISMPDEWEYPWFASWDLAFHCVALAHVDPEFAKEQLVLLGREWAMHPDGQLPAYEWAFGDVNPPVHAWAAWQVYVIDGSRDREFLIRVCTEAAAEFQLVGQPQGRGRIQSVRGWIPRDGQYWLLRPLCAATTRISARAV